MKHTQRGSLLILWRR